MIGFEQHVDVGFVENTVLPLTATAELNFTQIRISTLVYLGSVQSSRFPHQRKLCQRISDDVLRRSIPILSVESAGNMLSYSWEIIPEGLDDCREALTEEVKDGVRLITGGGSR